MRSFLTVTVYCISLLSVRPLLALPADERPDTDRLDLLSNVVGQRGEVSFLKGSQTTSDAPPSAPALDLDRLPGFPRHPPASAARLASPGLAWARSIETSRVERRLTRVRRHAHTGSRGGHSLPHDGQLMRVSCVLGTCQVHNLSHWLYQLFGQKGKENNAPINPKNPHSFG